jgi:hypothetical protein
MLEVMPTAEEALAAEEKARKALIDALDWVGLASEGVKDAVQAYAIASSAGPTVCVLKTTSGHLNRAKRSLVLALSLVALFAE